MLLLYYDSNLSDNNHHHHNYLHKQIILDSCPTNLRDILTVDEYPRAAGHTVSFVIELDKHNKKVDNY